jgi:oligosaccharyltransferase complex subunit epsilon
MWTAIATQYAQKTSPAVKTIDAYLACTVVIGLTMMFYCFAFAPIPYNSFLASFLNSVGSFVLAGTPMKAFTNLNNR